MLKRIKHHIRTYFLTGLLVLIPVGLTIYVLKIGMNGVDNLVSLLPPQYHPDTYLPFPIPGLGLMITLIVVFITGIITTTFIGKKLISIGEQIVDKIPLLRSVYILAKQVMETLFSQDKESFKKVVMLEYPRRGIYSIGFITGVARGEIQEKTSQKVLNVFVPTSPNPTSGFLLMVPETDLTPLKMEVDAAFKLILSGGMVTSEHQIEKGEIEGAQINE